MVQRGENKSFMAYIAVVTLALLIAILSFNFGQLIGGLQSGISVEWNPKETVSDGVAVAGNTAETSAGMW